MELRKISPMDRSDKLEGALPRACWQVLNFIACKITFVANRAHRLSTKHSGPAK
jgi:hypothetical protein